MRILLAWCWAIASAAAADGFVTRSGTGFALDGHSFHAAGANCYYVTYKSPAMVDAAFADAKAMGARVVRIWGFLDCGTGDPGAATPVLPTGSKDGVYFQYWDATAGAVRINGGADGLERLDYAIAAADRIGLKVAVSLVNNWGDFGGMDQYLAWYGKAWHDEFYSDATVRQAYLDYVTALLGRTNTVSGRVYRDDPAVFAWELANEPRCIGANGHDRSSGWTSATITGWAGAMAAQIKALDPNHLVAVGDEGFFKRTGTSDWAYLGEGGVDHEALLALPDIDYGTFHLYPDNWGKTVAWGTQWIVDHCAAATTAGKPVVLGEYGYAVPAHTEAQRIAAYAAWGDALRTAGGDGSWFWMVAGYDPGGPGLRYPDYDHFTVYLDGAPWQPGTTAVDDDDAVASQAWLLHGLDNRAPVAVAAMDHRSGPPTLTVVGDASGSSDPDGQALTYAWDFGDGTTANGASPTHAYAVRGAYTATLTVTDPYGATSSATLAVTVLNRAPTISASAPVLSGTAPLTVDATALGADADGDALTYAWDLGDGTAATGAAMSHAYAAGSYTATVTVTDGFGGSATATLAVTATAPPPAAPPSATPPAADSSGGGCGTGQGLALLLASGLLASVRISASRAWRTRRGTRAG